MNMQLRKKKDKWKNHQDVTYEARIWKLKRKVIIPRMAVQHIFRVLHNQTHEEAEALTQRIKHIGAGEGIH